MTTPRRYDHKEFMIDSDMFVEESEAGKGRKGRRNAEDESARYFSGNYALSAEAALPVWLYISHLGTRKRTANGHSP